MKRATLGAPPGDAEPVYSTRWNRLARIFRIAFLIIAVVAATAGVEALVAGAWPFAAAAIAVSALGVVAWRIYDVKPVFASPAGLWVIRESEWRILPWARVGKATPFLNMDGPIMILQLKVEDDPRLTRFIATRSQRDALERCRSTSGSARS